MGSCLIYCRQLFFDAGHNFFHAKYWQYPVYVLILYVIWVIMALHIDCMKKRHKGISILSAQITATISVSLVLLLLGIISMLGISAHLITTQIQENIGFSIVLSDVVTPEQTNSLKQQCADAPYMSNIQYISKEDALARWKEEMGEDLMSILEVNPFRGVIEVNVKSKYASSDSINAIIAPIKALDFVDEVNVATDVVDSINNNFKTLTLVLSLIACVLLIISFALINNTVHLAVYARRFTIHTMRLVGATGAFIRKPFLISNIIGGVIAGIIAGMLLLGLILYIQHVNPEIVGLTPWDVIAVVLAGLIIVGMMICGLASLFSTNKYLRADYDDMCK